MMALFQTNSRAAKTLHFTGYSIMAAAICAMSTSMCIASCIVAVKRDPFFDGRRKLPMERTVHV